MTKFSNVRKNVIRRAKRFAREEAIPNEYIRPIVIDIVGKDFFDWDSQDRIDIQDELYNDSSFDNAMDSVLDDALESVFNSMSLTDIVTTFVDEFDIYDIVEYLDEQDTVDRMTIYNIDNKNELIEYIIDTYSKGILYQILAQFIINDKNLRDEIYTGLMMDFVM